MMNTNPVQEMPIEARMAQIESFSSIIKSKREKAVNGRKASGIEEIWQEDQDHREGVDQYNEAHGNSKPKTTDGTFTTQARKKAAGRSTAFVNITRPYSDAASARVGDILLPSDDRNWALRPTPDPVLIKQKDDMRPVAGADGMPIVRKTENPGVMKRMGNVIGGMFGVQQTQEQPQEEQQQHVTIADMVQQDLKKAREKAERAQQVIDDWLTECHYNEEVRKVIESTATIGVGIIKGPIPVRKQAKAARRTEKGWEISIEIKTVPTSKFVDAWNFYPDPNCGELIENGEYVFEKDTITARELKSLKGSGYISEMIDMCLEEGVSPSSIDKSKRSEITQTRDDDLFTIWYFYGQVSKKDMEAAGCECDMDFAPCIVTMVNDRIIKISLSPLDTGEFPYDVMVWQVKQGSWAGVGVSRQMRTCQKGLNGAVRALMDNASLSSAPQIIIDTSKIEPADGNWRISPAKLWRKKIDADEVGDVRQAFTIVSIETRQAELLNIIQFWSKSAEDVTGLPMLLQGQQGKAPETVGGMTMLNNNANSVLRRIARNFDDRITIKHIGRYYEWLLMHGNDDAKGDYQIQARGSSALVERDIQNQALMNLLNMSGNPAFGLDPEKLMKEVLKSMRLDSKNIVLDEEQKNAMQNQPLPVAPQVEVAKIRQETEMQKLQMTLQDDLAENQLNRQQAQDQFNANYQLEQLKVQIAQMKVEVDAQLGAANLDTSERMALENIKADLSGITMKLRTQKELSQQVLTPPSEPEGRAPNGQAFQR